MPTPPPETQPNAQDPDFEQASPSIVTYYNKLLDLDHEITKPVAAIESLTALLSASPPSTVSETLALIESSTSTLKASVPNPIALSAGTDLFQRYIVTALQSGSSDPRGRSKRGPGSSPDDFGAIRAHLLANSKLVIQRAKEARGSIARIAKRFVQDGSTVLTCGASRVVSAVLNAAADDGVLFQVIYVQSSNPTKREQGFGRDLVLGLRGKEIPVAVTSFDAVATAMAKASFCMVGAESVVENGGITSSLGTRQIGLLAKSLRKPFYVAVESHKFVRVYPLGPEDLGLETGVLDFKVREGEDDRDTSSEREQLDEQEAQPVESSRLDLTPPELITGLVTEKGVQTPSAVSEELIKIWY
ncbi:MAG: translation initiation factor eIF-2B subunit alpha [Ramalina farinacea]|uniref:Translation initiation factor eIF2B subunit alpha n=1 Tax=Ramalina farinacea TaxID=258253 RepID=A0AA43QIR2_9LECA|nr:translation initiation factor eIF-2B subunit alpha [Ramalina farinacea]